MDTSPLESSEEFAENLPKETSMEGQISKRQHKAWEWSSIDAGRFIFRKPFFEAGKWRCRRIEKDNKKAKRITLKASTLREAKDEIRELSDKEKVLNNTQQIDSKITLDDAMDKWLTTLEIRDISLRSYTSMGSRVKQFIDAKKFVDEIKFHDIEDLFIIHWKNKKSKTKQMYRILLVRFFEWGIKRGYCRDNPASKFIPPKKWSKEIREACINTGQALSLDEARKLVQACLEKKVANFPIHNPQLNRNRDEDSDYLFLFVLFSLLSGLRKSNLIGSKYKKPLLWGDVNLENGTLQIDGDRMKNGLNFHVPLHDELWQVLKEKVKSVGRIPKPDEPIIKLKVVKKSFNSALKKAGLSDRGFRIHDLRHSYASQLAQFCSYGALQRLMAHAPRSVTDKYIHLNIETLREQVNKLPWLSGKAGGEQRAEISL